MTKNVDLYHGKRQSFLRDNYWSKMQAKIIQYVNNGFVITGICYNHGLNEYLVVMTESTASQNCKWFKPSEECEQFRWLYDEYNEKRHPTILFLDPNDDRFLVVCTSDKKRSGFNSWFRDSIIKQPLMTPKGFVMNSLLMTP